jgi:hypothetical protein
MIANSCFKIGYEMQKIEESKVNILLRNHIDTHGCINYGVDIVSMFSTHGPIHVLFGSFVNYKPCHKICGWQICLIFCYSPSYLDRTHVFKFVLY